MPPARVRATEVPSNAYRQDVDSMSIGSSIPDSVTDDNDLVILSTLEESKSGPSRTVTGKPAGPGARSSAHFTLRTTHRT